MESLAASSQDNMIHSLDFSLSPDSASYVEQRSETCFYASSNSFSPNGLKAIRIAVAASTFVDLGSAYLTFRLHNNGADPLLPATTATHCLFSRYTATVSGSKAEDIQDYARTTEHFLQCMPNNVRRHVNVASGLGTSAGTTEGHDHLPYTIPAAGSVSCTHKPILSGICTQGKWWPVKFMGGGGIILEWVLNEGVDAVSTAANHNHVWHIPDVKLVCSTLQLNSSLSEAYAAHVMGGRSLLLPYKTYNCTSSAVPTTSNHDISVPRSFSRLCTVFQTFAQADEAAGAAKECNTFFTPLVTTGHDTIGSHIQIGEQRWPECSRTGAAQHYVALQQALGIANSVVSACSIGKTAYGSKSYIQATDVEKVPQASLSGHSTANGAMITLSTKSMGTATANRPIKSFVVCHHDCVAEISSQGCEPHQ